MCIYNFAEIRNFKEHTYFAAHCPIIIPECLPARWGIAGSDFGEQVNHLATLKPSHAPGQIAQSYTYNFFDLMVCLHVLVVVRGLSFCQKYTNVCQRAPGYSSNNI